jgi:hypothetical protein
VARPISLWSELCRQYVMPIVPFACAVARANSPT